MFCNEIMAESSATKTLDLKTTRPKLKIVRYMASPDTARAYEVPNELIRAVRI